jgi:hypothetical protein
MACGVSSIRIKEVLLASGPPEDPGEDGVPEDDEPEPPQEDRITANIPCPIIKPQRQYVLNEELDGFILN